MYGLPILESIARPGREIALLFAGANLDIKPGLLVEFQQSGPRSLRCLDNGTDDTVIVWDDGEVDVLRTEQERDFHVMPIKPGRAEWYFRDDPSSPET